MSDALDALQAALRINLYTTFNILSASAKAMQKNGGGSIVLTSAVVAERWGERWWLLFWYSGENLAHKAWIDA